MFSARSHISGRKETEISLNTLFTTFGNNYSGPPGAVGRWECITKRPCLSSPWPFTFGSRLISAAKSWLSPSMSSVPRHGCISWSSLWSESELFTRIAAMLSRSELKLFVISLNCAFITSASRSLALPLTALMFAECSSSSTRSYYPASLRGLLPK